MAGVFKDQRDSAQIDHARNFTEGKDLISEFNFGSECWERKTIRKESF
jgi:hypothetical protein